MFYFKNVRVICMLLRAFRLLFVCESLIHADFIPLFVIHVWHPHFPLYGIKKKKKYLTCFCDLQ